MNFLFLAHIIALFLASIAFLGAGFLVFLKRPEGQGTAAALVNFLWSLSVAFWAVFMMLVMIAGQDFILRITWILILLIPITNVHFVATWLGIKKRLFIKLGYLLAAVFGIIYIAGIDMEIASIGYARYFPKVTGILYISSAVFLVYMIAQFYYLYSAYKNLTGIKKHQVGYFLLASTFGYLGGMSNYAMALGIFIPYFDPFANYLLVLYPIVIAYAILKYQLFDIKIIIQKTLLYSFGIALLAGFLTGVSFLSNLLEENVPGFKFWLVPVFVAAVSFILGRIFWKKSVETEKLKYEFITVAAHKLRTPLTEIKWGIDSLSGNLSPNDKNLIMGIRNSNNRLLELANQLLAASKTEKGEEYKLETAQLDEITNDILDDLKPRIIKKNIKLDVHFEQNLPKVKVDKMRIALVIQSLLENAVDYTKDRISIHIYNYKNKVIFTVEDNGIGILKEDQNYIFSRMYRTHDAYLAETEGGGLSLYLAKNIVERHGGKIKVRSEGKNTGSEFLFELPESPP